MILALKFHAKIKEFFSPLIFYPIRSVISSGILLHSAWWRVANDNPNDVLYFWVSLSLCFKSLIWKWFFILMRIKSIFITKVFSLSLVFKVRVSGTRKWPNNFGCLTFLPCSSLLNVKHDHWSTNMCLTPDTSKLWCNLFTNGWLLLH